MNAIKAILFFFVETFKLCQKEHLIL